MVFLPHSFNCSFLVSTKGSLLVIYLAEKGDAGGGGGVKKEMQGKGDSQKVVDRCKTNSFPKP